MRRLLSALLCLFLLTACVKIYKVDGFVDNEKTFALINSIPNQLGVFESDGRLLDYEVTTNGLGYSKKYNIEGVEGIWADVYSYHMRMKEVGNLPNGADSVLLLIVVAKTIDEIKSLEGRLYRGISETAKERVEIKGGDAAPVPFWKYSFTATKLPQEEEVVSSMFLTVYAGSLLKVRISYFPAKVADGTEKVDAFMAALAAGLPK